MAVDAPVTTKVEQASRKDLPQLRDALARAFYEDPVLGWLMPDERKRPRRLRKFFELELGHIGFARGIVWTTAERTGACVVLPPDAWQLPPLVALAQSPGYLRAFGGRLAHATALQALMELRHPRTPHHYVLIVGVEPELQGRGIGNELMRPTLEHCDRIGLPTYLEASSDRSAELYERLGFRTERELRLGSSPPLRLMIRPPAA
jgi:GNAT superfamily N-acetyltransferase